jgi:hypothetical protein
MLHHLTRRDQVDESSQMSAEALERFARRDPMEQELIIRVARLAIHDPNVPKRQREIAEAQASQLERVRRMGLPAAQAP